MAKKRLILSNIYKYFCFTCKCYYICNLIFISNILEKKAENIILLSLSEKPFFTKKELANLLHSNNLAQTDNAFRQLVYKLTQAGMLQSPKRALYTTRIKPKFNIAPDNFITKTRRLFTGSYSEIKYCIWSSSWLHEFMVHQPFSFFYIFETEDDMLETTFNLFSDNKKEAFLKPNKNLIENYISRIEKPVVIDKLPSRSPLIEQGKNYFPSLEKILVDIFCNTKLFSFYQGNEMNNIFVNATKKYYINYSSLLSYATNRGKKQEIKNYLEKVININPILTK